MNNHIAFGRDAVFSSVSAGRQVLGLWLARAATLTFLIVIAVQSLYSAELISFGFSNWFPVFVGFGLWALFLCLGTILRHGEGGAARSLRAARRVFHCRHGHLPNLLRSLYRFQRLELVVRKRPAFQWPREFLPEIGDDRVWNALGNMGFYVATVLVQYAIAFGLALLLNSDIKGQRLFRVAFLLPFMLSPVAVSWMIGKSMLEFRFRPVTNFLRHLGWENPSLLTTPWLAKATLAAMDAWVWIPFMMILILAGLQALSKEIQEAAKVDGASAWAGFWEITFPLMLPVSITTIVLRIIFQLKLADIVINTTSGGPGGATDTVSSFIFREYKDRSNVGYGTMVAEAYLFVIIIFVVLLLN